MKSEPQGLVTAPLSFTCDRCSKCCKEHRVPLTLADLNRLVAHMPSLGQSSLWVELLDPTEVDILGEPESLLHLREGRRLLALAHRTPADGCVFLAEGGCSVHEARPSSCRTYPFETRSPRGLALHPSMMCPAETRVQNTADADPQTDSVSAAYFRWVSQRDQEACEHATWVQSWNKRQKSRLRLGKLAQNREELFAALLSWSPSEEATAD